VKPFLYGLTYVLDYRLFGKTRPLIRGLVLTNRCNLRCRHCTVPSRPPMDLSYPQVRAAIDAFYAEGGRCLYLEGGEPLLWRDGPYRVDDIVGYAKRLGYLAVVVYTNGTLPLDTTADTVFVSVDGLRETHDALRGKSYDRIMANVARSAHPSLYVNYTINSENQDQIEAFCATIDAVDQIRGTFFYFHTPYYGRDALYLEPDERRRILRRLLEVRKHHKVLNSRAGLRSALANDWQRPLESCSVYEDGTVYPCCRYPGDPELCRQCGYLSYAEIDQTLKLKPSAILNALKYF
jgi:MoaA/NifB/PqqE/SkfB family radical SAM enzyme